MSDDDSEEKCIYCHDSDEPLILYQHTCGDYKIHQKCLNVWIDEYKMSCIVCRKEIVSSDEEAPQAEYSAQDLACINNVLNNMIDQEVVNNPNIQMVNQQPVVENQAIQVVVDEPPVENQVIINQLNENTDRCVCCNEENRCRTIACTILILVVVGCGIAMLSTMLVIFL